MSLEPPVSPDEPPDPAGSFDDPEPGAEMSLAVRRDGALLDPGSLGGFDSDDLDSDDLDSDDLDSDDLDSGAFVSDDLDSDGFESDPPFESGDDPESEPLESEDDFESDDAAESLLASACSLSFEGSAGRVPSGR